MFVTQLMILTYAIFISYSNYKVAKEQKKHNFLELYFIAMILAFIAYLANFLQNFLNLIFPEFALG